MTAHVLVVDDSPQNLLVASRHLEASGYHVATATSGEEALAYLETTQVDLVILDVLMPGIGGFETCRRIRAKSQLPVMFMTALGDRDATAPALDAGADDLVAKPFTRAELLLRTGALIRQHRAAKTRRATAARVSESIARLRELAARADEPLRDELLEEIAHLEDIL
jgi:DNA-binding response OmpR family regulator